MCSWAGLLLHRHVSDPGAAVSLPLGTRWVNWMLLYFVNVYVDHMQHRQRAEIGVHFIGYT